MDWDDLRVFLACADAGSFRAAARRIAVNSATVVRRIERLERLLAVPLFVRVPDGVRLTEAGARVKERAAAMEKAAFDIARSSRIDGEGVRGLVKIAITEGLGTYWVLPRLVDFQQTHRQLVLEMDCAMTPTDVARLQADISIQFDRPESPDLVTVRLAYLHIYPFASRGYLETFGTPRTQGDLLGHRLIQQVGPLIREDLKEITAVVPDEIVAFRTNGSTAMLYAIERDVGIGFLPSYASLLAPSLLPVDVGLTRRLEVWMTYHPDLRESRRHMLVAEWLRRVFDARRFPCFAEAFIHPGDLAPLMGETARVNMTDGYGAPSPAHHLVKA